MEGLRGGLAVLDDFLGLGPEPAVQVLADGVLAHEEKDQAGHQRHAEEGQYQAGAEPRTQDAAAPFEIELGQGPRHDEQQNTDGQHIQQAQGHQRPFRRGVDAAADLTAQEFVGLEDHPDKHRQPRGGVEASQLTIALEGHGAASGVWIIPCAE